MNRDLPNIYANLDELRRLQHQARGFSFKPAQPVNSVLSGKNASKLRGRGLNFEELRHYRPGDDIRCMDWKVTRRTGKPHIKVFTEERERNVYLAVDQRSSMFFGSTGKMKSVIAAELAALIAWRINSTGDRVGAIVFGDSSICTIPAKRGVQHVIRLLAEVVRQNHLLKIGIRDENSSACFNQMLAKLIRICCHNTLIVHIGDGAGWNDQSTDYIKQLRQHNEIIACDVFDPLERELPKMSQMVVSDGRYQIQFSSDKRETQEKYDKELGRELSVYAETARQYRIPLIPINTLQPVEDQLRKALGRV
ncbi:MAG: DUF58 domain-containing protein [Spongiibacteraceae bacterium]|nr:DUF58 domain-containing protein [Spongiibacteraceae bacterium]